jgi:hypothetical protein
MWAALVRARVLARGPRSPVSRALSRTGSERAAARSCSKRARVSRRRRTTARMRRRSQARRRSPCPRRLRSALASGFSTLVRVCACVCARRPSPRSLAPRRRRPCSSASQLVAARGLHSRQLLRGAGELAAARATHSRGRWLMRAAAGRAQVAAGGDEEGAHVQERHVHGHRARCGPAPRPAHSHPSPLAASPLAASPPVSLASAQASRSS